MLYLTKTNLYKNYLERLFIFKINKGTRKNFNHLKPDMRTNFNKEIISIV